MTDNSFAQTVPTTGVVFVLIDHMQGEPEVWLAAAKLEGIVHLRVIQ